MKFTHLHTAPSLFNGIFVIHLKIKHLFVIVHLVFLLAQSLNVVVSQAQLISFRIEPLVYKHHTNTAH